MAIIPRPKIINLENMQAEALVSPQDFDNIRFNEQIDVQRRVKYYNEIRYRKKTIRTVVSPEEIYNMMRDDPVADSLTIHDLDKRPTYLYVLQSGVTFDYQHDDINWVTHLHNVHMEAYIERVEVPF